MHTTDLRVATDLTVGSNVDLKGSATLKGHRTAVSSISADTAMSVADSGGVFQINAAGAVVITLPEITANNLGVNYKFYIGAITGDASKIKTATNDDTTGDVFSGSLLNITNAANGPASGAVMALVPGADEGVINLDEDLTNAGVQVGSYIECTAFSFSSDGHSVWLLNGYIITDLNASNGSALFSDDDS